MKQLIYCFLLCVMTTCALNTENASNPTRNHSDSLINANELNGTWGMTQYFDSIVSNKTIVKYRVQYPTWFGILIEIDNDSLFSYGSLIDIKGQTNPVNDTVFKFNDFESGHWMLLKDGAQLALKQFPNQEWPDSSIYRLSMIRNIFFLQNTFDLSSIYIDSVVDINAI